MLSALRMAVRQPRHHIGQRLSRHLHPVGVGVDEIVAVRHESDMAGEKDDVAPLQRCVRCNLFAQRGHLLIRIAGRFHAAERKAELDKA